MKKFLSLLITMAVMGCAYYEPIVINSPPVQENVQIVPRTPNSKIWRSDPTRVIVQNYSERIYVRVWLGRGTGSRPSLELRPEEGSPANFPDTGLQVVYIQGYEKTARGVKNLGIKKRFVEVSHVYGDVREIVIDDGDFYDGFYWNPRKYIY